MAGFVPELLRTVALLLLVCALAYVALRWRFRRGGTSPQGTLHLIARLPLGTRQQIILVEAADRRFLVGFSESGIALLCELSATQTSFKDVVL